MGHKIVLKQSDNSKVWINLLQTQKMVKTPDGRFWLYLMNGEVVPLDPKYASDVENFFEGRIFS